MQTQNEPPILRVDGLTKRFRMHHLESTLHAFENISFDLRAGEFILLRGHNGAGKSTLLRTLWRSYLPVSGRILYRSRSGDIDLARAALFLASDDGGFVTGHGLVVDGGLMLRV